MPKIGCEFDYSTKMPMCLSSCPFFSDKGCSHPKQIGGFVDYLCSPMMQKMGAWLQWTEDEIPLIGGMTQYIVHIKSHNYDTVCTNGVPIMGIKTVKNPPGPMGKLHDSYAVKVNAKKRL